MKLYLMVNVEPDGTITYVWPKAYKRAATCYQYIAGRGYHRNWRVVCFNGAWTDYHQEGTFIRIFFGENIKNVNWRD